MSGTSLSLTADTLERERHAWNKMRIIVCEASFLQQWNLEAAPISGDWRCRYRQFFVSSQNIKAKSKCLKIQVKKSGLLSDTVGQSPSLHDKLSDWNPEFSCQWSLCVCVCVCVCACVHVCVCVVWQYVQVQGTGCTNYLLSEQQVNLRV